MSFCSSVEKDPQAQEGDEVEVGQPLLHLLL
jgi:hypothetical protein